MTGWDREYLENKQEYYKIFDKVLTSNQYADLSFLEKTICEKTDRKYAVSVNSGTDALFFALLALNIKPDDEILVTNFSWISSASCVSMVGAIPVFCDIDVNTYHISLTSLKRMTSKKTKAIIYPHLFGNMCNINPILDFCNENKIYFIEDACQSIGSSYQDIKAGSIGNISTLSFNANKNIAGIAGGGAIVTDDEGLAIKIKKIRAHGEGELLGYNSKMLLFNATIINHRLKSLEIWQNKRQKLAKMYDSALFDLPIQIQKNNDVNHNYHRYVIRLEDKKTRDELRDILNTQIYYDKPLSETPMYKNIYHKKDLYPNSKLVSDTILSLPLTHFSTEQELQNIIKSIWQYYDN